MTNSTFNTNVYQHFHLRHSYKTNKDEIEFFLSNITGDPRGVLMLPDKCYQTNQAIHTTIIK